MSSHLSNPDEDWSLVLCAFRQTLIDGTLANGNLMRRKVDGVWQYRKLTPEEAADEFEMMAW